MSLLVKGEDRIQGNLLSLEESPPRFASLRFGLARAVKHEQPRSFDRPLPISSDFPVDASGSQGNGLLVFHELSPPPRAMSHAIPFLPSFLPSFLSGRLAGHGPPRRSLQTSVHHAAANMATRLCAALIGPASTRSGPHGRMQTR